MPDRIAFWDIDGTLISESMERHFLRYLIAKGYVSNLGVVYNLLRLAMQFPRPRWHRMKLAYLRGKTEAEVNKWIDQCWNDVLRHQLFESVLREFYKLKSSHHRTVLLTGTPIPLAKRLADHIGTDHIIAATPELNAGRYTGRLVEQHPYHQRKATYAANWCAEHGSDLSEATAYANHYHDRHLLERVGIPVAVNPDPQLAELAKRNKWRVLTSTATEEAN